MENEGSNLEPNEGKSKIPAQPECQLLEKGPDFLLALQML